MNTSIQYNRAFQDLIRGKKDTQLYAALEEGKGSGESYLFPYGFPSDYREALARENLFRRYGRVFTHVSEDSIQAVTSTAEAKLTDEATAYPEDSDRFEAIAFGTYKIVALAKLPVNFIRDRHFDLSRYLKTDFARRFGRAEEQLLINGTGTNEPLGLLKASEVGVTTAAGTSVSYDEILALYFSLKPEYRQRAVWLINDKTALALRSLKDSSGRYLIENDDMTLLGKPIVISEFIPDIAGGTLPIIFGDLSYFWILERTPLSVQVLTEKYALAGQVGFAAHERLDGVLIRPEAVKALQMKA